MKDLWAASSTLNPPSTAGVPVAARRAWKDDPAQGGGILLDLGTHLADQALALFGMPEAVGAEMRRERDGEGSNDSFTVRLHYPGSDRHARGQLLFVAGAAPLPPARNERQLTGSGALTRRRPRSTRSPASPIPTGARNHRRLGHAARRCGRRHGHAPRRADSRRLPALLRRRPRRAAG